MKTPFSGTRSFAFTLVEVLVSVSILILILGILLSITGQTQKIWKDTQAKASQFREARNAFESINRRIRQATLNTYWDYDNPSKPTKYERRSELRFISGPVGDLGVTSPFSGSKAYGHAVFFQGAFGFSPANPQLNMLLNTWGYYTAFTDGKADLPGFIASGAQPKWRMRLYEFMEPSESQALYGITSGTPNNPNAANSTAKTWFQTPLGVEANSHALAENVIALIIRPKENTGKIFSGTASDMAAEVDNIAPNYRYDSSGAGDLPAVQRAQLPPIVQITLVAIDDETAGRLTTQQLQALGDKVNTFFKDSSKNMEINLQLDAANPLVASKSLENYLVNHSPPISYRVYTSNINLSGSKWSSVNP